MQGLVQFFTAGIISFIAGLVSLVPIACMSNPQKILQPLNNADQLVMRVDKENAVKSDFYPQDLRGKVLGQRQVTLRAIVWQDLEQLLEDSRAAGLNLMIRSSFRDFDTQQDLFTYYVAIEGFEEANTYSAQPGHSEHQLGTTIDFGTGRASDNTADFALEPEGRWLAKHAYKYGFVLSYPPDKEDYTGYVFEPWHYRYVGVENALILHDQGLTLNEFQDQLLQNMIDQIRVWQWVVDSHEFL